MATEEERAKIMAEYLAGADEDDGLGDFDPDDEVRTFSSSYMRGIHISSDMFELDGMGLCE